MEFLLLWADEIDDAVAVLRHFAPRIVAATAAMALLAATGFALTVVPQTTFAAVAIGVSGTLLEFVRRRRSRVAPGRSG